MTRTQRSEASISRPHKVVKVSNWKLALAVGGMLAAGYAGTAQAQIINPFGVNNGTALNKQDYKVAQVAVLKLLNDDSPGIGRYETWSNPASGNRGKLTILKIYTAKAMPCREVKSTTEYGKAGSAPHTIILNACKIPSGEWKTLA